METVTRTVDLAARLRSPDSGDEFGPPTLQILIDGSRDMVNSVLARVESASVAVSSKRSIFSLFRMARNHRREVYGRCGSDDVSLRRLFSRVEFWVTEAQRWLG